MALQEEKEEITTHTSTIVNDRGIRLMCKYWQPVGEPKALIFIAHGYAEHCLPYDTLAKTLARYNFYVFAHDHEGHGQSGGSRAVTDSFHKYVDDVFQHTDLVRKKYPNLDCFLCGHSMGGAISILAGLRKPDYFKGIVLIGPAVMTNPKVVTPFKTALAKIFRWITPHFPVAPLDMTMVCSCPKEVEKMQADPLRYHGFVKAGFGVSLTEGLKEIESKIPSITFPFLICQGEEDKICIPEGAILMQEKSASEDKTVKMYPEAYHCLLVEPNGIAEQVIEDITEWLNARA